MMREFQETTVGPSATGEGAKIVGQKPFVIRGHHLLNYINLLRDSYAKKIDPAEMAKEIREHMEVLRSTPSVKVFDFSAPKSEWKKDFTKQYSEYAQDNIGSSTEDADTFEAQNRKLFEEFLSLSENYPADIVEEIPDNICNTCIIGKHCRQLNSSFPGTDDDDKTIMDGKYIDVFLEALRDICLPQPIIVFEEAYFSDAKPQQVRRVKTTMEVVRKILKETSDKAWNIK